MSKKRLVKSICCLLLCAVLLVPLLTNIDAEMVENGRYIYNYLTGVMGLNKAAACGILADIYWETGYNPNACGDYVTKNGYYVYDSSGNKIPSSYGICGWHDGYTVDDYGRITWSSAVHNWTNLKNYCNQHGYDWTTLEGQMHFLQYDLQYGTGIKLWNELTSSNNVPNTPEGAYYAASAWCYMYERPANPAWSSGYRGEYAINTVWNNYGGGTSTISELTLLHSVMPSGAIPAGSFSVRGQVVSPNKLTEVRVKITDAHGTDVANIGVTPNDASWEGRSCWLNKNFDIRTNGTGYNSIDDAIPFSKLGSGSYLYQVIAKDAGGAMKVWDSVFYRNNRTACTVSFDTGSDGTIGTKDISFGDSITLPAAPTKTGYIFAGWSDGTAVYQAGDSYRVLNSKVTLTALWTACEHQYDEGTVTTQPTCTTDGVMTYTCTVCGATKTEPIPMTGHQFGTDWRYDATNHWHVCTCGETGTPESHSFADTVTPATPEAQGYTTHTCTVCAYSYQDSYTDYSGIPVEEPFAPGDLTGDGYLDSGDIRLLSRYLTGGTGLSDEAMAAANVDGIGTVNAADLVALARRLLKGS